MNHEDHDAVSLALAHRVADGLTQHPEWIEIARENLDRWSKLNPDAPGLLRCYVQWQELLQRPVSEIRRTMTAGSSEGQRLRANSPFVGVLAAEEVRDIKRRARNETKAA